MSELGPIGVTGIWMGVVALVEEVIRGDDGRRRDEGTSGDDGGTRGDDGGTRGDDRGIREGARRDGTDGARIGVASLGTVGNDSRGGATVF